MSDTYNEFGGALKYDPQEIARQGWGMAASGPGDDRLIVGFYPKSIVNVAASRAAGKRVCETKDYVKIQHPGETLNVLDRPVKEEDKFRWPRQWALYQQGKEQIPDGIPISLLFPSQPSITDMLTSNHVHTIEQLAALSGHAISSIGMGAQEWVNKAADYMKKADKGVNYHRFDSVMAEKDQKIATLERQIRELIEHVAKLSRIQPEPQNFDVQASQTAALKREEIFSPEPVAFSNDINPRRRGRPPGSRNKPKE